MIYKHSLLTRLEYNKIQDVISKCATASVRVVPNNKISIFTSHKKDYDLIEKARFNLLFGG